MSDEAEVKTKTFEGRHRNRKVKVIYRLDKHSVRIVCSDADVSADYIRSLIVAKKIGLIDSVLYSRKATSKVVGLIRGPELDRFLRRGQKDEPKKAQKTFSDIAAENEA